MVASSVLDKGSHLHAQLDTGIRDGGDGPFVGAVVVSLAKDLFKGEKIVFGRSILLPSEQQDRSRLVWRLALHLAVYKHGGIL